ncbi:MAG: hypothetical protein M0Q91_08865 [Methanoregula sp.]|jgi:hypothetical protein|nr:hypothetical protein [Methanoregula sp.]
MKHPVKKVLKVKKQPNLKSKSKNEIRDIILEGVKAFSGPLGQYQWPFETARWHELIFCIIFRLGQPDLDGQNTRDLTNILAHLNLLNISSLKNLKGKKGVIDFTHPDAVLMQTLLSRKGLDPKTSRKIIATIVNTADGFQTKYEGKIQKYLRHYGRMMLDDLGTNFDYNDIDKKDVEYIYTHWLQNVLNMPLPLSQPDVYEFCQKKGIKITELVEIADELDLNLALLDDIIGNYLKHITERDPFERPKK